MPPFPKALALLQRPYIGIPLCGLFFLALHSVFYPSTLPAIHLDSLGDAVDRFHLPRPFQYGQPNAQLRPCNPYSLPGILHLNMTEPWLSTYDVLGSSPPCTPRNTLLSQLIDGEPVPSTRGASVLIVGDSVDRELVRFFHYAGKVRPLKPVPVLTTSEMTNSSAPLGNNANNGFPKAVHYPQFDFTVRNYHFCGLDRQGIWPDKQNPCNDPAPLEPRFAALEQWYKTLPREPDLIIVQSSLWDIARFQREQYWADGGDAEVPGFSQEFLLEWIQEMSSFVRSLRGLVSNAPIIYRIMHEAVATEGTWFKPAGSTKDVLGPTFSELRVHQIREAQRYVADKEGLDVLPLGDVLIGHRGWLRDDIHPGIPGNALYAEMILEALDRIRS